MSTNKTAAGAWAWDKGSEDSHFADNKWEKFDWRKAAEGYKKYLQETYGHGWGEMFGQHSLAEGRIIPRDVVPLGPRLRWGCAVDDVADLHSLVQSAGAPAGIESSRCSSSQATATGQTRCVHAFSGL